MKILIQSRLTSIIIGLVALWVLIGALWVTSPRGMFVGYIRFQLDHRLRSNDSGDGFHVERGGDRGGLVAIVRNGSRRPVSVSHVATGLSPNDILGDASYANNQVTGHSSSGLVRVDNGELPGNSSRPFVVVGEGHVKSWDVRCFPVYDSGNPGNGGIKGRELPSAFMLSIGECCVIGMVIMVVTLTLPHPARHLGKVLKALIFALVPERIRDKARVTTMGKKHIFMSYGHADEKAAKSLRDELIHRGESVWWDKNIKPGSDWQLVIRQAIQESYAVVVVLSDNLADQARSGVFPEMSFAISILQQYPPGSIFLIPVRLSDCEIPKMQIDSIRTLDSLQYVDLFPPRQVDRALERLVDAIREAREHPSS